MTKTNQINTVPAQFILSNPSQFSGYVVLNSANMITYINNPLLNLGAIRVDSFDFGASYQTKEYNGEKLNLEVDGATYHYSQQNPKNGNVLNYTDIYGLPDFKLIASIFYLKRLFGIDTFQTGITLNYIDSEHDYSDPATSGDPTATEPNGLVHIIGSSTTFDWQILYEVGLTDFAGPETPATGYNKEGKKIIDAKAVSPYPEGSSAGWRAYLANTKLTFGINDIADTKPPFADQHGGYDSQTGSALGRYFYVEVKKTF